MLFDTHAHLTMTEKYISIDQQMKKAKEVGLTKILDAGTHPDDFELRHSKLCKYENVLLAAAYAPHECENFKEEDLEKIVKFADEKKIVAISEIGLEYHYFKDNHLLQQHVFSAQLDIAKKFNLPVFLHIRDGYSDAHSIVKKSKHYNGAIHCFTGDKNEAKKFLDLGFHISFSGIVTFKNSDTIREALKIVPLDRILTETDAPFLSPMPKRGEKNISANIYYTNEFIADFLKIDQNKFNEICFKNAEKLLKI